MYQISPPAVYAHESVMNNPVYRARMQRVVSALKEPREIITFSDRDVPDLILKHGVQAGRKPMALRNPVLDPILLFNTFRFDSDEQLKARRKAIHDAGVEWVSNTLLGAGAFIWFDANLPTNPDRHDRVCRPCWRIHQQGGCVHKCSYCNLGGLLGVMLNVEEFCGHLERLIELHPWQTTYLLDDDADPPCLEPELGTLGYLIEFFGRLKDRYLIIHTKTWNTDWMRHLRHNGHTIMVWSLSGPTQSRLIEPVAGTTEQRIEAARICQEAGYPVRYKFKPIVPVRTWREDASMAIKLLFERTRPDMISLCVFMWNTYPEMLQRLPVDLLEPEFVKAAEASQAEMANTRCQPFPHDVRRQIYEYYLSEIRRIDPHIPVSLSTENFKMWDSMKNSLQCTAANYVCGCGPQSIPGSKKLTCNPFTVAVRNDQGLIPGIDVGS